MYKQSNGGSWSYLGIGSATTFTDAGVANSLPWWAPSTPPSVAQNDWCVNTIASGGGTTSLSLNSACKNAASNVTVYHDDTAALQNWANAVGTNIALTAHAGTFNFSSPITVPHANDFTFAGAGPLSTTLRYVGSNTSATLLTINTMGSNKAVGVAVKDFNIVSLTPMTGGYAIRFNGLYDSFVSNVFADDVNSLNPGFGNLCGGFWFNGAGSVQVHNPVAASLQNCGDGVLVNSALGGTAELKLFGGDIGGAVSNNIVHGFANGMHMAGGFGGLRCDSTNVHNNLYGVTIDEAVVGAANREFVQGSTCVLDSNQYAAALLNDSGVNGIGAIAAFFGDFTSTQTGPGLDVEAWANASIYVSGSRAYNNCGDGILDRDSTANILIGANKSIVVNGRTALGSGCASWQTTNGSGTGATGGAVNGVFAHGFGVEASSATANIASLSQLYTQNTSGPFNANSGIRLLQPAAYSPIDGGQGAIVGINPAITNLAPSSSNLANGTYWNSPFIVPTANAAAAPDGTTTATLFTSGGSTINQGVNLVTALTTTSNQPYNYSMFFKPGTSGNYVSLFLTNSSGTLVVYEWFDIVSCASVTGHTTGSGATLVSATAVRYANGYCRVSMAGYYQDTTMKADFYPMVTAPGSNAWSGGNGFTSYTWGAQITSGSALAPYVKTGTASATLPAGTPAIAVNASGVNLGPGTTTVGALPSCNAAAAGQEYLVSDASSPTWGATLSGGGSTQVLALCNGSSWTAH